MSNSVSVLVVDDDPVDLELMRRLLKRVDHMQCDVTTVDQLPGALQLLSHHNYDVLLLDLNLPGSSGLETLDAVRGQDDEIPVIVVSGRSDQETALQSLDHGAQDYLVKGKVTSDGLVNSIRYAIQRQQLLGEIMGAKELLERKNERLAELYQTAHRFVDNVSHEFRTPLTVIKEYTLLIRDGLVGPVTDEQCRFLDIVSDRSDDLNTMVDDMLDVSRLEAGLLGVCRKTCRVADIVENLRTALERKAAVKGVILEIDLAEPLPEVYCDDEKVRRVIINLTVNAIKFCQEDGHVRIWATENPQATGVVIGVTDTGPGIEEGSLKRIFERFSQLDVGVRTSCKGFGLGLNIAQELVDMNFGEMNVESEVGHGSTFTFTLPPAEPLEVMQRYLRRIAQLRNGSPKISLITARIDKSAASAAAEDVDAYLHHLLRRNDLAFRVDDCLWLLVIASSDIEVDKFYDNAAKALADINRNRIHGPLPKVAMRTEGTWHVINQFDEVFTQLRQLLESRDTVHV